MAASPLIDYDTIIEARSAEQTAVVACEAAEQGKGIALDVDRTGRRTRVDEASGPAAEPPGILDRISARALSREEGPLYRQLAAILRRPILGGDFPPGIALPREADLARRFGVSLITVRQALRDLEGDGLIKKRAAKPAIVTALHERADPSVAFRSFVEIAASTRERRLAIHSYRQERSRIASKAFGLAPDAAAWCLRATLFLRDEPAGETRIYFPPSVGARLKRRDFDDVVVFRSVQRHLGITLSGARITVRAEAADATLARALEYVAGGPVLVIEMLFSAADGTPVELTINRNRADRFSLTYDAPNDLG
jgi:GntR family transcriptional regulator